MAGKPDLRPRGRVKDPAPLRRLHLEWRECALCGETDQLSLHHVYKHPRNDLRENLVMLCGDGVQGCHGLIEAHDPVTRALLGRHLVDERPDVLQYLSEHLGPVPAELWLERTLAVSFPLEPQGDTSPGCSGHERGFTGAVESHGASLTFRGEP